MGYTAGTSGLETYQNVSSLWRLLDQTLFQIGQVVRRQDHSFLLAPTCLLVGGSKVASLVQLAKEISTGHDTVSSRPRQDIATGENQALEVFFGKPLGQTDQEKMVILLVFAITSHNIRSDSTEGYREGSFNLKIQLVLNSHRV